MNHRYWSYLHQLNAILGASHCNKYGYVSNPWKPNARINGSYGSYDGFPFEDGDIG